MNNIDTLKIHDIKPGDLVRSIVTSQVHKVVTVNTYWGTFSAVGPRGRHRNYTINPRGSQSWVKLTPAQKADHLLELETLGTTVYWRED